MFRSFPRSIDRGLIEAKNCHATHEKDTHFPGLLIGASLKHHLAADVDPAALISPVY